MPVIISLLRGINVGGHNPVGMEKLRALYESLGMRDAQTYVQSGNVIARTAGRNLAALSRKIEHAIEMSFAVRTPVILRTGADLAEIVKANPFAGRPDIDPAKLLVTFLANEPSTEARAKTMAIRCDPEEMHVGTRELYTYFPNGLGRPKLNMASVERALGVPGTGRNWNTVLKLLAMAKALE